MLGILVMVHTVALYAAKEIEIKITLEPQQYRLVQEWARKNARYVGETEQKEYYVTDPRQSWDYSGGFKDTLRTMRIRQEAKGDSFCYKYRHLDAITKKTTHRDEYETKVQDGATMLEIIRLLGYTEHTLVHKKRVIYLVDDIFELVFDDVTGVGRFIEIELKESTDDVQQGMARIEGLLKEIGVKEFTSYDRGYIHMIWNPGYDFGYKTILS